MSPRPDDQYNETSTPGADVSFDDAVKTAALQIKPNRVLYTSVLLALLQPFQSGWSTSQLNLSDYNNTDECNARPVVEGTCTLFSGHSKLEWTFAVNSWIFGAMVGSLLCGYFSDLMGRKKLLFFNCFFMIGGAVIQASVSNIWPFAVGRAVAGIASGAATGTIGAYVNELSPPHLRSHLGLGLQISTTIGILVPAICFFFADSGDGWRYMAGFPVEAKQVITRLYGEEHVQTALAWLEPKKQLSEAEAGFSSEPVESIWSPKYRMQFLGALLLSCTQQLSGINAVFYYSGNIFSDAGISDSRVGTLIIDFINIWPAFFTGVLSSRFGNRNMILWGIAGMVVMSIGMTVAFLADVSALSIVFTALYVIVFGVTLGPLVWVMTADMFPDSVRASASSICIGANWLCNLIVGVGYPYLADEFDDWSYMPFTVLLVIFYVLSLKLVPETAGKTNEEIQAETWARKSLAEDDTLPQGCALAPKLLSELKFAEGFIDLVVRVLNLDDSDEPVRLTVWDGSGNAADSDRSLVRALQDKGAAVPPYGLLKEVIMSSCWPVVREMGFVEGMLTNWCRFRNLAVGVDEPIPGAAVAPGGREILRFREVTSFVLMPDFALDVKRRCSLTNRPNSSTTANNDQIRAAKENLVSPVEVATVIPDRIQKKIPVTPLCEILSSSQTLGSSTAALVSVAFGLPISKKSASPSLEVTASSFIPSR
ncbi:Major facilitator superfamily domain [Phytophthora cactorum]|nr:Major facilitator superfamily domain [Phytophthora cactorum]